MRKTVGWNSIHPGFIYFVRCIAFSIWPHGPTYHVLCQSIGQVSCFDFVLLVIISNGFPFPFHILFIFYSSSLVTSDTFDVTLDVTVMYLHICWCVFSELYFTTTTIMSRQRTSWWIEKGKIHSHILTVSLHAFREFTIAIAIAIAIIFIAVVVVAVAFVVVVVIVEDNAQQFLRNVLFTLSTYLFSSRLFFFLFSVVLIPFWL